MNRLQMRILIGSMGIGLLLFMYPPWIWEAYPGSKTFEDPSGIAYRALWKVPDVRLYPEEGIYHGVNEPLPPGSRPAGIYPCYWLLGIEGSILICVTGFALYLASHRQARGSAL
jgi:hypothetical protein